MASNIGNRRMRIARACDTCRQRKRKCRGDFPCDTCTEWGYDCYVNGDHFPARDALQSSSGQPGTAASTVSAGGSIGYDLALPHPRLFQLQTQSVLPPYDSRNRTVPEEGQHREGIAQGSIGPIVNTPGGTNNAAAATTPEVSRSALNTHTAVRSLTANSGAAFVRRMGLKLDPANAPRLNLFGWNIGARELSSGVPIASGLPIEAIVSYDDMRKLADVYMRKVHTCYGFIDEVDLSQRLDVRWKPGSAASMFDSVLAGIAAIGLLFSERTVKVTEILLVELAKSMLESYDGSAAPPLDIITGSLLRVIYMRMTAPPYATWLASSKLIHLIEAAGLHREGSDGVDTSSLKLDPTLRRRLLGVAQHQNMWTSYDLGLSPVRLKTDISSHAHLGNMPSGDFTDELLGLLPASVNLDPEQDHDDHDLQMTLIQILDREHTQPPSIMAQTNVVLCILRRLHLLNINTSPNLTARILQQFKRALESARTMVEDCSPWQHMPNVPFNIITILLELDTYAALDQLPDAMETLKTVASAYNTPTMREAYATARLLVYLYQQRRFHDAQVLGNLLSRLESDSGRTSTEPQDIRRASDLEVPFLEELISDIPTLQGFDFEQFLNNADMEGIAQGMDFSTEL